MFNRFKSAVAAPSGVAAGSTAAKSYYKRPDDREDEENQLIKTLHSRRKKLTESESGAKKAADALRGTERTLSFLRQRAERMQKAGAGVELLDPIRSQYDSVYRQWRIQRFEAAAAQDAYNRGVAAYNQTVDAYSQFKKEHEEAIAQWRGTIRDSETVKAELDAVQAEIRELSRQDTVGNILTAIGNAAQNAVIGSTGLYPANQQHVSANTQKLDALREKEALLQEEYDWGQHYYYADMQDAADFGEKSAYVTTANGQEQFNPLSGTYTNNGFDDAFYDYVNRNQTAKNRMNYDWDYVEQMTDDEIGIYNYVYATQGQKAAEEYLNYLKNDLTYRQRKELEADWADYAKETPVKSSIFSTAMSPLKGIGYLQQAADYAVNGSIDENASYNRFSHMSTAIRNQVSSEIKDSIDSEFWGNAGSFGYQTAMSMADFLTNALVSGGNAGVATAIMGSGAAADTVLEAKDRGLSDGQAFTLGTIAGVAEAVTEKYSLDALLDKTSLGKNAAGYVFKNILAEGSEEGASTLINTMADILISKDKSQWRLAVDAYKADGKTEGQAFGLALRDQALALGVDMLGGALSGGVMAGGNVAITKTSNTIRDKMLGQAAPQTLQEFAQQQVAENLGKKKAAQVGTVELAWPSVQVSSDVWQQSQRLAAATGRHIRLYEDAENVNGSYDPETGIIWVNTKGGDVLTQVFSHEMTHSLEEAGAYGKLSEIVLGRMQATGIDLDVAREAKRKQYERQGHALQTAAEVDQELVAEYVSKYLLTDEASIVSLVKQDRTLGQRIKDWFDGILAKLGNKNAQERAFLVRARDIYAKALRQTQGVGMAQAEAAVVDAEMAEAKGVSAVNDPDPEVAEGMRQVEEAYARGEIGDAEYDQIMDEYERWQEERRTAGERKYSFAGEKAKTADLPALLSAVQLTQQGADPEVIQRETGWFKGADGKWRFEIDDSGMRYHRAGDALFSEMHPDYARHQELEKKLLYGELAGDEEQEYRKLNEIWGNERQRLSDRVRRGNATLQNVLQHDTLFEAYPELRGTKVVFAEMEEGARGSYNPNTNTITISEDLRSAPEGTLLHEIQHAIQHAEGFSAGTNKGYWMSKGMNEAEAENAYRNSAGEVEARDVASRRTMTAEERKNSPPDLGDENTVFVEAGEASLAAEKNSIKEQLREHQDELLHMEPVAVVYAPEGMNKWNMRQTRQWIEQTLQPTGYQVDRNGFGVIVFDAKRLNTSLDYLQPGGTEVAAYAALPKVLKRGLEISGHENHKGRDYETVTIAAPIVLNGKRGNMAVVVKRTNKNYYKMHRVLSPDGAMFVLSENNNEAAPTSGGGVTASSSLAAPISSASKNSVPNQKKDVKQKFSLNDDTVSKKDVARELQAILQRGGDIQELKRYVAQLEGSGGKAEQKGASAEQTGSEAEQIVRKAKQQGVSVEQHLQENAELYDVDGQWNADARKALEMEKNGSGRKYSVSEGAEAATAEENSDVRNTMPKKAKDYLKRVERELLWAIADKLSVPKLAGREYLQPIIQEMVDEYLKEGTISQETKDLLFEKAYAQGVVVDAEFYNQYKHIKDHLRNLSVTISDRDKADIADFKDFRRRAFGTLRIVNEGGLPVDTAYQELHSMAPELFPESITHPADQLVRMYDAARSIQVTEKTVQDYYGEYEPEYRRWAKADFEEAVSAASQDLWAVKRYADEKAAKDAEKAPATAEEAAEAYKELKAARRTYERAAAKNLLSEHDQMQVGRLLRHEIELEHLNPEKDNVKGITAVFEAKQEYERLYKLITEYKQHLRGEAKKRADRFLQTANDWKDKKMGIAYSRETMERNIFDIVKDKALAQRIIDQYFTPVHKGEAAATRFKNDYRDRVRALQLSTKVAKGNLVSEAHAVQLLGEAEDNIRMLENTRGRIKNRDGKNLSEWRAVVEKLWAENPNLDKGKIEKAVKEFRYIYDALFQKMNQVRVANGYEPVNYRNGYFPHFQPGDSDSILAQFGRALGIDTRIDALPTTINGLTHTFKPGIQWFGNAQERLGFNTAYDAVEGFDRYIEGVASVIHQTANIQNLRALASQIRYRTSDEGIREQVDAIQERPGLSEEEKQQLIQEVYAHGKFTLSNFVTELDEYTNLLANKKSRYDRSIEAAMGRKAYTFLKAWEARVGANMIAGNLTSALTNFIPLTQAGAQMDRFALLNGMLSTLRSYRSDDGIVNRSTFLTNRRGSDPLVQTWAQKASEQLGKPMELIDGFAAGSIVRGAYLQNLKRGMSAAEAMDQADAFAASVMADRSKGAMPTMMQATNPLFKAFTQFQLEVNNQFSEVFKDIPRRFKEKGLLTLAWVLLKYFLGAWIYNELYEELIGRRPALDPIGMLCQGYDDLQNDGFGAAGANLAVNALEQLPFSSGLTLIGVELDGGRIPASSAVPDLSAIWSAATTEGWSPEKRWKEVQDELWKLAYVVPPFGGNQISKTVKGLKAYFQGGSYSVEDVDVKDEDGNVIGVKGMPALQYPVYKDDPGDAFWNLVKAAFLGKSSLGTAQDWVDSGFDGLNADQTAVYRELLELGAVDREAFDAVTKLGKAGSKGVDKLQVIYDLSLTDEEKAVLVGSVLGTDLLTESGSLTQYAKFDYAIENGMEVDQYIEYRLSGASIDEYLKMRDAGATVEDAMNAGMALAELRDRVEDPTTIQKWRVVVDSTDDTEKQMISLSAVMTDSQYAKVKTAYGFGVSPEQYIKINELLPKYDADGNGRYTQAEVTKAISAMSARASVKAVLWQLITGSSTAKNNPYSQSIGKRVIDALAKAKAQQEETGTSFQDEIMRQILGR